MLVFIKKHYLAIFSIFIFFSIVLFINPFHEAAFTDDWAYAKMAKELAHEGQYKFDHWAVASPIFQVFYGALLVKIFGFSFGLLKTSTILVAFLGFIGFYYLALEYKLIPKLSLLLTFILASSPLVVLLGFTFMTDIPYMSFFILSMLFYTKALKQNNYRYMLIASIFSSLAILIRQNGYFIPLGLTLLWLIKQKRREKLKFYIIGLILPYLAIIFQIFYSLSQSNWGTKYVAYTQSLYFSNPTVMLLNFAGRIPIILIYLSLFTLPLVSCTIFDYLLKLNKKLLVILLLLTSTFILGLILFSTLLHITLFGRVVLIMLEITTLLLYRQLIRLHRLPFKIKDLSAKNKLYIILKILLSFLYIFGVLYLLNGQKDLLLPYLPWNFEILHDIPLITRLLLTLFCLVGSLFIARLIYVNIVKNLFQNRIKPDSVLLFHLIMGMSFLSHLAYYQLGDEYLLIYLPYIIIVLGVMLESLIIKLINYIYITSLILLIGISLWTRSMLESSQANWLAAEYIRNQGVSSNNISTSWEWIAYYEHDNYLKSRNYNYEEGHEDFFGRYIQREKSVQYLVTENIDGKHTKIMRVFPYRDVFLKQRYVYAVRK